MPLTSKRVDCQYCGSHEFEISVEDGGKGYEMIRIFQFSGLRRGRQKAFREVKAGEKVGRDGEVVKEVLCIDRDARRKTHRVWKKANDDWVVIHDEDETF